MKKYIENVKNTVVILALSMTSTYAYADVNWNDKAENLLNAKVTTLIDFNNPKTRPAYGYVQNGVHGEPRFFTPDDQGEAQGEMISQFLETNPAEGELYYEVVVDMKDWGFYNRFTSDVFLPKNNSYKITRSSRRDEGVGAYGSFYHLSTESIYKWVDGTDGQGRDVIKSVSLHITIQRFKVIRHRCSNKDDKELVKYCKGKKSVLRVKTFYDDFSIGEVISVLKPIVSIDLSTIPKVVIPGNSN